MNIAEQIRHVRQNIQEYCAQSERDPRRIRLLAVSKTHPSSAIQAAYASGITDFGESYVQEAVEKVQALRSLDICWHFIGPLQSNKTRTIAENFDWVQSVDREKILSRLNAQRPGELGPISTCIQANLFNETQKKGASVDQLTELLAKADELPNIKLRGLMVIPPRADSFDSQLQQFQQVATIYRELQQHFPHMDTLSMGMSGDIHAAIAAGSDMVRVGTGIFGPRGSKQQ